MMPRTFVVPLLTHSLLLLIGGSLPAQEPAKPDWKYAPDLMRPFWQGNQMEGESVLFIKDSKTGEAKASVLFPVEEVLAVRNSAGDVTYEKGRDYIWKRGSRELILPASSRIVSRLPSELRRPAKSQKYELTHRDGHGEILFGARLEYADMQTCITYSHAPNLWKSTVPKFDAKALPRSIQKLRNQQPLSIVLIGDSISAGCNASGWAGGAPFQPPYPELLRAHLEARYRCKVALQNPSVSGTDTRWVLTMIDKVVEPKPDLVIVAFGMNDSAGRPAKEYQANIEAVLTRIRERLPEVEFILVASMLGNRDWTRLQAELFPQYRDALASLCGQGTALADLTSVWGTFLELKHDWDQTGNGVNHPNDFGHRVYAQVLSALLVPEEDSNVKRETGQKAEARPPQSTARSAERNRLSAMSSQPVYPVLIRNEHGPITRVVVQVEEGAEARARSFTFSLAGTDDLGDLESLSLYSTGDKEDFSLTTRIGASSMPAREVTFQGEWPLVKGRNVFWLSCQLKPSADLSHRVAAVCDLIDTTSGKLSPREERPGTRHRIGVALRKHQDDGVHTYRIPALATSSKGTLLCVYDMRRRMSRDLQEDIDIGLSRSTDAGQSWQPVRVIMDMGEYGGLPQELNGCSDPGIIVDRQTGEIFCFAVWMNGKAGKHQWTGDGSEAGYEIGKSAQFLMVRSQDDGLTWTKPENLTRKLKKEAWWLVAPSPQQGIQLGDGTLVMPAQGRDEQGKEFSTIMTSQDHGVNWTVATPAYSGGSECQVVQLRDGSLMLNMRNEHERFRAVYTTRDLGQTWKPHATNCNTLIEPNCNGSLIRIDSEVAGEMQPLLIFANPHTKQGRTHQTIQVSFDDGQTWPSTHHLLLDEGRGAGYPSLTRVDERHIGIVYEGSQSHLVFEKVSLHALLKR